MSDIYVYCSINGFDLNSIAGLQIVSTNPYVFPVRALSTMPIASSDKSANVAANLQGKDILVRGNIRRASRDLSEQSLATLYEALMPRNASLIFRQGGELRRYTVTTKAVNPSDAAGSFITFEIIFEAADPYGYAVATTTLLSQLGVTSGDKSYPVTVLGNTEQYPTFTLTLNSVTNGEAKTITLINPANEQQISVTRTWVPTDVLVVDTVTPLVTVNGDVAEFEGAPPEWAKGAGHVNYTDNFTERNINIVGTYYKRTL